MTWQAGSSGQCYRYDVSGGGYGEYCDSVVVVNNTNYEQTLGSGSLSSSVAYLIDGTVTPTTQIVVPSTGLRIWGRSTSTSKLVTSADAFTLIAGSLSLGAQLDLISLHIEVTGSGSSVININGGLSGSVQIDRCKFESCTSVGTVEAFAQLFINYSSFIGGTPTISLAGITGLGVRVFQCGWYSMDAGVSGLFASSSNLFGADGTITLIYCTIGLPSGTSYIYNGNSATFSSPNSVRIQSTSVTRGGLSSPGDANYFPNLSATDYIVQVCSTCIGLTPTSASGKWKATSGTLTTINTQNVYEPLAWTGVSKFLVYFSAPTAGKLVYNGRYSKIVKCFAYFQIQGTNGNVLELQLVNNVGGTTPTEVTTFTETVENYFGSSDCAVFAFTTLVTVNTLDELSFNIRNTSGIQDVTLLTGSNFVVIE